MWSSIAANAGFQNVCKVHDRSGREMRIFVRNLFETAAVFQAWKTGFKIASKWGNCPSTRTQRTAATRPKVNGLFWPRLSRLREKNSHKNNPQNREEKKGRRNGRNDPDAASDVTAEKPRLAKRTQLIFKLTFFFLFQNLIN